LTDIGSVQFSPWLPWWV